MASASRSILPLSATQSTHHTTTGTSSRPSIPIQQSPPSAPAFSEDSELLRIGHLILGEGSTSSITHAQITISSPSTEGYGGGLPIEHRNSLPHNAPISPAIISLLNTPDSSTSVWISSAVGNETSSESSVVGSGECCVISCYQSNLSRTLNSLSNVIIHHIAQRHANFPSNGIESSASIELDPHGLAVAGSETDIILDTHPLPNPLTTTLGRDAILAYSYRLYQSQRHPEATSILSAAPVFNIPPAMTSSDVYSSQLVPLLTTLRSQHPHHLPTLLLLGSVYYSMDDLTTSLRLNEEILSINPEYVSCITMPHTQAQSFSSWSVVLG